MGSAAIAPRRRGPRTRCVPGQCGHWVVTVELVLFAYSTILGWSCYGERNIERPFGRRLVGPWSVRVVFSLVVFIGCTVELAIVWAFADVMNGLMALRNMVRRPPTWHRTAAALAAGPRGESPRAHSAPESAAHPAGMDDVADLMPIMGDIDCVSDGEMCAVLDPRLLKSSHWPTRGRPETS